MPPAELVYTTKDQSTGELFAVQPLTVASTLVGLWDAFRGVKKTASSILYDQILKILGVNKEQERWYCQMDHAASYEQWLEAAQKLDEIEGHNKWKQDQVSPHYDSRFIQERLDEMRRLERDGDITGIMFNLQSGLVRGLGGVSNPQLHQHAYVGTKKLIEDHSAQVVRLLEVVCEAPESQLPIDRKLAFFAETRHALGKTALLLSGGASLGMYHFGVIKALHDQGLLPRVISGSSAGSIVTALVGVRTATELSELFEPSAIDLTFFPPAGSLRRKLRRLLFEGHLMEVKVLQKALQTNLGNITFYEAYERTGRIINITVSPANEYERPRLLNYLTAPNVLLWSAACASCAFPILFQPVELVAKDKDGLLVPYHLTNVKWKDGSMTTDLPTTRLSELFNVNHFIVSQTNPHAIPFMSKPRITRKWREHAAAARPSWARRCCNIASYLLTSELAHRFRQAINLGLVPKILEATLFQPLGGDITIVPPFSLSIYSKVISNPTWESVQQCMADALRCTWPVISQVRTNCEVEIMLDQCARRLAKMVQDRNALCQPETVPSSAAASDDETADEEEEEEAGVGGAHGGHPSAAIAAVVAASAPQPALSAGLPPASAAAAAAAAAAGTGPQALCASYKLISSGRASFMEPSYARAFRDVPAQGSGGGGAGGSSGWRPMEEGNEAASSAVGELETAEWLDSDTCPGSSNPQS